MVDTLSIGHDRHPLATGNGGLTCTCTWVKILNLDGILPSILPTDEDQAVGVQEIDILPRKHLLTVVLAAATPPGLRRLMGQEARLREVAITVFARYQRGHGLLARLQAHQVSARFWYSHHHLHETKVMEDMYILVSIFYYVSFDPAS